MAGGARWESRTIPHNAGPANAPCILLDNVTVAFEGRTVLDAVSLRLTERKVAVIGANGSGKTTLARLLNGLVLPDGGRVTVDGHCTRAAGRAVRGRVGFVFQNPEHQILMPTVAEDVAFGLANLRLDKAEIAARTAEALAEHGLAAFADRSAHLLSGGEQKLLTLVAVLVMRPEILVLDEPLSGLDIATRRRLLALFAALPQRLITVTHDFDAIAGYDRAIWLAGGRIAGDGPPAEVIATYRAAA